MTRGPWDGDHNISCAWRYSTGSPHFSWDIGVPMRTSLYAIGDGVIVDCNDGVRDQPPGVPAGTGAPSNWIILRFEFPKESRYAGKTGYAYYQHLTKGGVRVRKGQRVKKGELIGKSGNSGNTSGPHLHLTILKPGYRMAESSRYNYLNNPTSVVWEPRLAWLATRYGIQWTVYVSKLKPGKKDSASVRLLRKALIQRKRLIPAKGLSVSKPGNDYTDAVKKAVKQWQEDKGFRATGTLTRKQVEKFFEPNVHIQVKP